MIPHLGFEETKNIKTIVLEVNKFTQYYDVHIVHMHYNTTNGKNSGKKLKKKKIVHTNHKISNM